MKRKQVFNIAGLIIVAGSLLGGGYALGQGGSLGPEWGNGRYYVFTRIQDKYSKSLIDATESPQLTGDAKQLKLIGLSESYVISYADATGDQEAASKIIGDLLLKKDLAHKMAEGTPKASVILSEATVDLLTLQAMQNQKIIQLLTELKNKK